MTGQKRVDPFAVKGLLDRGRIKQAKVGRQNQEYQRQGRGVNDTRQKSGSQAQAQAQGQGQGQGQGSGVRGQAVRGQTQRSQVAGWITLRNVSQGRDKTSQRVWGSVLLICGWVNEVQVWQDNQGWLVIGDSCVIGAMVDGNVCVNDGSCSPWVMCNCSVVSVNQICDKN